MTDEPIRPEDEQDALAGELSLRVLSPDEETAARDLARRDPAFARRVEAWDERLAGMADAVAPVQPSAGVWARIAAAIAEVANDNERLRFWRRWAVGSTGLLAASLVAVAVLMARPAPVAPPAPAAPAPIIRVSSVAGMDGGPPMVMLAYDAATGRLYVSPTRDMARAEGVPHLWLVMPDNGGVHLIGAIDGSRAAMHNLDRALGDMAGQAPAVAISMEAPGHTPAVDKPDGPVVATGELSRL